MKFKMLLAVAMAAAIGAMAAEAQQSKQLSIATGGTGGVYYPLGGGFGNILGKELPGVTATAQVTGGSVANLQLIGSGKADIALSQVDAAWDAINGKGKFASGKLPIQALAVLYPNHMHVVTVDGTGITKVEDMKGKRVSTGSPGSATEVYALRVIEAAGLDPEKDMRRERLGVAESVNALKDRKIEAFFWVGGLPTAAVTDLASTPNTKIKVIDIAHLTPKLNAGTARSMPRRPSRRAPTRVWRRTPRTTRCGTSLPSTPAWTSSWRTTSRGSCSKSGPTWRWCTRRPSTSSPSGRPPTAPASPGIPARSSISRRRA
jgi:TRAP transporter TAXI family solute receptor